MKDLQGKVVVVTGAADGIGRALAEAFAAGGARLVLADVDGPRVEVVGRELADSGTDVIAVRTDVSDREQVLCLRDAALDRFGAVDVLCNNAGVMGPVGDPLWELPVAEWRRVMEVNLWGVLHGIQAFVPAMLAAGHPGHVLNTASMQGVTSGTLIPEYTVSKHAVVALSESLRAQLAARQAPVGVSVLCPGAVSTGLPAKEERRLAAFGRQEPWALAPGSGSQDRNWGTTLTPAQVARAAVAAVRDGRFYVFTHPGSTDRVRARTGPLLEAADQAADQTGYETADRISRPASAGRSSRG
ncbi:SDR family NAD(P)-dependent oxidoreductase [Streptomyces sp. NPDC096311]|uniref:SDR family NAD(P)-dependent oxidoreductase n=1 Tax=Streptomyces sp. NPDC096311 TaxID=3366083 RepID=UPI0037FDB57A